MAELKPCHFCGVVPKISKTFEENDNGDLVDVSFIMCESDECEVKPCTSDYFDRLETISAWNKRS